MSTSLILRGGRVIDPESRHDAIADVVVEHGRVVLVGDGSNRDGTVVDCAGQVVAPGFIDLHSHAYSLGGQRLQAMDGVTTALELEAGALAVGAAYADVATTGAVINYGFSASWAAVRMVVVGDVDRGGGGTLLRHLGNPTWQRPATDAEVDRIVDGLGRELAEGALGIGLLLGYAPGIAPAEYVAVARAAAAAGVPTYTHARELVEVSPSTPIDGAEEIVRAAGETGAHMHYCHVNSTSRRYLDRVLAQVEEARREGAKVSTEAYPYGAGSTAIGAYFLDPDRLSRWGVSPRSIRYMATGERVADADRLRELRRDDPGGLAIIDFLDEDDPRDRSLLHRALLYDDTIIASDAMPLTWLNGSPDDDAWPLPPAAVTHPRTAGTFSRSLHVLTAEHGMPLIDALRRMTLLPAQLLESTAPVMTRKGRVAPGADADLVVFDPTSIHDRATYEQSTRTSAGIVHVLVNGEFAVRSGELQLDARPGRAIRAGLDG